MHPMPPTPGSPYYRAPAPPRKRVPTWAIVVSIVALGLCAIFGTGTVIALRLMTATNTGPALSLPPTLPASVGESLVINNVTVTLTSAQVGTVGYSVGTGQAVPGVTLSLHFWNQTTARQGVSTGTWRLLIDGGSRYYTMPADDTVNADLQPNETQDAHFTIMMNAGDHGPYTLQSDFMTSQGQPLAWTFPG